MTRHTYDELEVFFDGVPIPVQKDYEFPIRVDMGRALFSQQPYPYGFFGRGLTQRRKRKKGWRYASDALWAQRSIALRDIQHAPLLLIAFNEWRGRWRLARRWT